MTDEFYEQDKPSIEYLGEPTIVKKANWEVLFMPIWKDESSVEFDMFSTVSIKGEVVGYAHLVFYNYDSKEAKVVIVHKDGRVKALKVTLSLDYIEAFMDEASENAEKEIIKNSLLSIIVGEFIVPRKDAYAEIDLILKRFPKLKKMIDAAIQEVRTEGTPVDAAIEKWVGNIDTLSIAKVIAEEFLLFGKVDVETRGVWVVKYRDKVVYSEADFIDSIETFVKSSVF